MTSNSLENINDCLIFKLTYYIDNQITTNNSYDFYSYTNLFWHDFDK